MATLLLQVELRLGRLSNTLAIHHLQCKALTRSLALTVAFGSTCRSVSVSLTKKKITKWNNKALGLNCNKFLFKILIKTSPQIPFLVALNEEGSPSTCTAGHAIPSQTLHVPLTWAHLCPAMNFTCSGKVSRWEFQSVRDDGTSVYLSVWRNNGPNRYQLVGYNVYNATRTGLIRYIVPEDEQILVQTNDFVGIYYDHKFRTGVVPFADPDHLGPFTEGQLYRCLNFPLNQDDVQNAMDTVGYLTADTNFVTRIPSARAFIEPGAPTDCGPLPDVKGGILQGQASNQLGSVVTIVCQPGFTRSGPSTITCTQQGIWSEFPTCTSTLSFLKHSPALLKYIFFRNTCSIFNLRIGTSHSKRQNNFPVMVG